MTDTVIDSKISVFGAGTFPITIYVISVLILIEIILIFMNKAVFYKKADGYDKSQEIDIRLNNSIFYIYLLILFIYGLGLYIYNDNSEDIIKTTQQKTKFVLIIYLILSLFNLFGILFLTYHIYKQIRNINSPCPEPGMNVCLAKLCEPDDQNCVEPEEIEYTMFESCQSENDKIDILLSATEDPTDEGTEGSIRQKFTPDLTNDDNECEKEIFEFLKDNFIWQKAEEDTEAPAPAPAPASAPAPAPEHTSSTLLSQDMSWIAQEVDLLHVQEEVKEILDLLDVGIPGQGIAGPPGPPGPPGNDGDMIMGPQLPMSCDVDGDCPSEYNTCNNNGECEPFTLISLEEKINLKNKYKDIGHNSYEADKLMNNLEEYLLKIFK